MPLLLPMHPDPCKAATEPGEPPILFLEPRNGYALLQGWAKEDSGNHSAKRWHAWIKRPGGSHTKACRSQTAKPLRFHPNVLGKRCKKCQRFLQGKPPCEVNPANPLLPRGASP